MLPKIYKNLISDLLTNFHTIYENTYFYDCPFDKKYDLPSVNYFENEKNYILEIIAPGLEKENFNIKIKNDILKINIEQKEEKENKSKKLLYHKFNYFNFKHSYNIPSNANKKNIKAEYKNGILNIIIPKKESYDNEEITTIEIK